MRIPFSITKHAETPPLFLRTGLALSACVLMFIQTSCGTQNQNRHVAKPASEPTPALIPDTRYLARFTDSQAKTLASSGATPQVLTYGQGSAQPSPVGFASQWGDFTVASQVSGFLPTGNALLETAQVQMISLVERVSLYSKITTADGKPLYATSSSRNASGQPAPEKIDGKAPAAGEVHFALVTAETGGPLSLPILLAITIRNNAGVLQVDITNATAMKAKLGFLELTAVEPQGLLTHTELFPYQGGYLVFGVSRIRAASSLVAGQMGPETLAPSLLGILDWMKRGLAER